MDPSTPSPKPPPEPRQQPSTPDDVRPIVALQKRFGFDAFRPGQEAVIRHLLEGRSAAAVFPTGGGKSLCYQLPALLLPGLTLVISPLIALMKDQIDALRQRDIAAARLDSSLDADEYRGVMEALRSGRLELLYVAPERFNNERFREQIERVDVALFAVDEAHCISEWGHNFRPDYLKLPIYARRCGAERILALTATAPPQVLDDICEGFGISREHAEVTGFYRPNLTLLASPVSAAERDDALIERLRQRPEGPGIVYVTLQRTAEEVAQRLRSAGFDARHYHAGMKAEERAEVQEAFLASRKMSIVATIAFGMGIDKPDIRSVDHYNLPKSLENLAQEIGRAGRDGEPSICELLVCQDDRTVLENFVYGDTPSRDAIAGLLGELFAGDRSLDLALTTVGHNHDLRALVLRTLLTQLELLGHLEAGTPYYASYRFKPRAPSAEILARFHGERRRFLADMFRQAKKGRTWLSLDLESAASALGAPRERLVRALDYLGEQELLDVEAAGVRHRYAVLQPPHDLDTLADTLHRRALELEARELARIDQVLELAGLDRCLNAYLCQHFGEEISSCGHCSWCLRGEPAELLPRVSATLGEDLWARALALRTEFPDPLADPRALTRFLTGLTSPRLGRKKLSSHPLFGCAADAPFAEILERAETSDVSS